MLNAHAKLKDLAQLLRTILMMSQTFGSTTAMYLASVTAISALALAIKNNCTCHSVESLPAEPLPIVTYGAPTRHPIPAKDQSHTHTTWM